VTLKNKFLNKKNLNQLILISVSILIIIVGFSVIQQKINSIQNSSVEWENRDVQSRDNRIRNIQAGPGSIWTTQDDCGDITQNVNQYCSGDAVYINGANFEENIAFAWDITGSPSSCDSNIIVVDGTVDTGPMAIFVFQHILFKVMIVVFIMYLLVLKTIILKW